MTGQRGEAAESVLVPTVTQRCRAPLSSLWLPLHCPFSLLSPLCTCFTPHFPHFSSLRLFLSLLSSYLSDCLLRRPHPGLWRRLVGFGPVWRCQQETGGKNREEVIVSFPPWGPDTTNWMLPYKNPPFLALCFRFGSDAVSFFFFSLTPKSRQVLSIPV